MTDSDQNERPTVLVLGGAGFAGRHAVISLLPAFFTLFSFGHWEMLQRDNKPEINRLPELLQRPPTNLERR
jgi:hypothetical protein